MVEGPRTLYAVRTTSAMELRSCWDQTVKPTLCAAQLWMPVLHRDKYWRANRETVTFCDFVPLCMPLIISQPAAVIRTEVREMFRALPPNYVADAGNVVMGLP